jgi:hypothetical protein
MPCPLLTPDYYFNFFTNLFIDIMFKFILFITRIRLLDLCVTERPSAEQSSRHKKHQRLPIVEFQKKWSADKFLSKQKRHPFYIFWQILYSVFREFQFQPVEQVAETLRRAFVLAFYYLLYDLHWPSVISRPWRGVG